MTQKFILAVSVVLATLVVTELTIYDAGYRLPGVELLVLGQAGDITTDHAPLPVYAAWFGYEFGGGEVGVARLNALAIGIAVSITALVSWHLAGLWAAMTTALIFLCFPGTLFHARTMGPEAISMLAMALLLAASVMDLARIRSVVLACVAMTAALACTPETSALAIVWLLLCKKITTPREIPVRGRIDVGSIPPGALLPVLVAPVALIGLWPHLHSQTGDRLAQYLLGNFFAPHPPIMVLSSWIDQTVSRGPSVFSGLLLFMQKVPLIVAILAVAGGIIYRAKASKAVGLWVALILTHVLNGSPYYAGIDGMAFHTPFLALLSGVMAPRAFRAISAAATPFVPGPRALVTATVSFLALGPLLLQTAREYPTEIKFQNGLVRLATTLTHKPTAANLDTSLSPESLMWINESLPGKAEIAFYPNEKPYRSLLDALKKSELLRSDIKPAAIFHADWIAVKPNALHPDNITRSNWAQPPAFRAETGGHTVLEIYRH